MVYHGVRVWGQTLPYFIRVISGGRTAFLSSLLPTDLDYWVLVKLGYHGLVLEVCFHLITLDGFVIEGFDRKCTHKVSRFTVFSRVELYKVLHCNLLSIGIVRACSYLSNVFTCFALGTHGTLSRHMCNVTVDAVFAHLNYSFICFSF